MQAGTFTFLFTDIEASTRRWEDDADAMSAALVRHDEVVRSAVAGAGGEVFKHTGDGICAVFGSAAAGLAAALAAQQGLAGGPLRVRMAVHTGAAEERDGDFFGPTLNRAARLMAAAWGGQTVLSAATAELAGDALPPGAALVDLGEHRLADLTRPERIFQLNGDGDETGFPTLRAVSTRRHNLPVALTRFVGRDRELGELAGLIKVSRMVSVVGVGGAGKTRLAIEAAGRAVDEFPDGVFLVELAAIADPEQVPATVAGGLGLILDQPGPLTDQLASYLERRRPLVVLDNCEHVVDAAAGLAETLLLRSAGVVVLATSREPLGVPGERVWRIPPLAASDAMDLLCDRARTAHPTFSPSEADEPGLARICERLDGIPLALELAAGRLHVLSAAEIATRLDDRFRLLTGGARTAVDRHRTLRATIDWGYDLLDPAGQTLLRRLSVFAAGFDLPAAEAVAAPDALDLLGGLVDRSWVAVEPPGEGPTRYRLIETIRQYAAEKLAEAGEAHDARRAHCAHFRRLATTPHVIRHELSWLRAARLDLDNFLAALEWGESEQDGDAALDIAVPIAAFLSLGDRPDESLRCIKRALEVGKASLPRQARALCYLAMTLSGNGGPDAERLAAEVIELAGALPDPRYGDIARFALAQAQLTGGGRYDESLASMTLAFHRLVPSDIRTAMWGAHNLGWMAVARSEPGEAERWFTEVLRLAEDSEDVVAACHASAAMAPLAAARGDAARARDLSDTALAQSRRIGLPLLHVMALIRSAEAAVLSGQPRQAGAGLSEAIPILRDTGTRSWVALSLELAAVLAGHHGDHPAAARLLAAAETHDRIAGHTTRLPAPGTGLARMRAHHTLGEDRYATEAAAGATLATDGALAFALATVEAIPAG